MIFTMILANHLRGVIFATQFLGFCPPFLLTRVLSMSIFFSSPFTIIPITALQSTPFIPFSLLFLYFSCSLRDIWWYCSLVIFGGLGSLPPCLSSLFYDSELTLSCSNNLVFLLVWLLPLLPCLGAPCKQCFRLPQNPSQTNCDSFVCQILISATPRFT